MGPSPAPPVGLGAPSGADSTPPFELTGRRLGNAVLLYLAAAVAVITLAPFQFEPRPVNGLTMRWGVFDVVMNVVLFVPVGFVYALSRKRGRIATPGTWAGALLLGFVLSAAVEVAQLFAPARFPSVFDLAANTAGSGVGAWLAVAATAASGQGRDAGAAVRALAVDLPLMGLAYLVAPLAWLVALGADDSQRLWVLAPLAAAAAWTIASVFTSFEEARRRSISTVTATWLAVALLPSAVRRVGPTAAIALLAAAAAWARAAAPARLTHETLDGKPTRRFEAATLRIVLPLLAAQVVLSAITPVGYPGRGWWGGIGLPGPLSDTDIFRALEQIAAFTLIGYAVAEYHGRTHHRLERLLLAVLLWTAPASAVLQWVRGWHPVHGASALLLGATVLAALGGGWLYVLQLEHVRALAARPTPLLGGRAES